MPAPPPELVTALRNGTVARHLFFYLDHPAGAVRAWDGVGDYTYAGAVYRGVAGFAELEGVSNSADIQNHSIKLTLNHVPLASIATTTHSIKKRTATITGVWLDEGGNVISSRVLFSGFGDMVSLPEIGVDTCKLVCTIRGRMADWAAAPRAFWTPSDQTRRYPGDAGLNDVPTLENANPVGWSVNEESLGGTVQWRLFALFDSISGRPIVAAGKGCLVHRYGGSLAYYLTRAGHVYPPSGLILKEETSLAHNGAAGNPKLNFGGLNAYVDTSGDVRTAGGKLVFPDLFSTANKLRKLADIATTGTATAEYVVEVPGQVYSDFSNSYSLFRKSGTAFDPNGAVYISAILDNTQGHLARLNASGAFVPTPGITGAVVYVEDVTGTALTVSAGGRLQIGGTDCVISTTGCVISPAGRRIYRQGGSPTVDFLRGIT